jgi:hypothetical protein
MKMLRTIAALALMLVSIPLLAQEEEEKKEMSLAEALASGKPHVDLRLRYELVDDADFEKDAHALTLRTAFGYRTAPYKGLSLFLEAQNVRHLGEERFNNRGAGDLANGVTDRPVVADPDLTRMQQVYLRADVFDTTFDLGRRQIAYGDHRFIGDIAWRQNFQTFDAAYLMNHSLKNAAISYAYADKVLRIFGDGKDMSSHFLNALVKLRADVSLEAFAYLLDYEARADWGLSSQSYGGKLGGSQPLGESFRLLFEAQYAKQKDFADNPGRVDADYLHLLGGLGFETLVNLKVGRELLSGSEGKGAFQTPLATGHKFNGWADLFLVTPPSGLVDWYLSADGKVRKASWTVVYHDFSADEGERSYGSELDAQVLYPTRWKQTFGFKFALYREDGFARDVSKLWLWTQYSF